MLLGPKRTVEPDADEPDLLSWDEAEERADWTGILIGNGASIACWDDFAYESLFEQARDGGLEHSLDEDDVAVFDAFGTENFEQVLAALKTARMVLRGLNYRTGFLKERYESTQDALFDAIYSVHVPWGVIPAFETKLQTMRSELEKFDWLYSLNYDLILYWAITSVDKGAGFADFFWNSGQTFDSSNTIPRYSAEDWPKIVWLHGGIHLRRRIDGTVFKETADEYHNLLEKFKTPTSSDATPLLVSEGTADDKYAAIMRSSYLEFGLRSLTEHSDGLVIFGSALRAEDEHLVRAIKAQPIKDLAISVYPGMGDDAIVDAKLTLQSRFPRANLYFFDSTTHPLGAPSVKFE